MKLSIVTDQTPEAPLCAAKLICADTGQEIEGVVAIRADFIAGQPSVYSVQLIGLECEVRTPRTDVPIGSFSGPRPRSREFAPPAD